jgi:hypothetical protein
MIPQMKVLLGEAIEAKTAYDEAEREIHDFQQHVMMMGGVAVDRDRVSASKTRRDEAASRLREAIETVQGAGVLIKDLDIGLIDFPTLYRGVEVYLCWKFGEDAIEFWHGVDEGFRGRKAIDQDFRDHHEGDREQ